MFTLSKNELEIMILLWQEGRSLSRTEIIALTPTKSWKSSSIHILLNSLLQKEAIQVAGFIRTGKNYGRTYLAAITQDAYSAMQLVKNVPEHSITRENLPGLFATLIHKEDIGPDVLEELQVLLDRRRKELLG
ncbi:MAG: putative regulatory protein [Firmicutes bacterium]|nr:putative regulatory protein [Bacillota bacterium]